MANFWLVKWRKKPAPKDEKKPAKISDWSEVMCTSKISAERFKGFLERSQRNVEIEVVIEVK